jgi:calcium-dependent protein kinase
MNSAPIGKGSFGEVRRVQHKRTKRWYACKTLRLSLESSPAHAKKLAELMAEVEVMKMLDHPNCIKVIEVFKAPGKLHIVQELAGGGELFDRLADSEANPSGYFPEPLAKDYMVKMLKALNYLHANKIAHRDLKLENFLLTGRGKKETIKLIDFGYSRLYLETGSTEKMLAGTPYYMPPEIFRGEYNAFVADVLSLGCILYMMVTGELPVSGGSTTEIFGNIRALTTESKPRHFGRIAAKVAPISKECQDLIGRMMRVDVNARISMKDALDHPWLTAPAAGAAAGPDGPDDDVAPYDSSTAKKLAKFKEFPDLKRAALMVAAFYLPPADIEALGEEFTRMDTDSNGVLDFAEFYGAMAGKIKQVDPECDIKASFEAVDLDKTMKIQYSEFIAMCLDEKKLQDEQALIRTAFQAFDIDGNGKITKSEISARLGPNVTAAEIDRIFQSCDIIERDGVIDQAEFEAAMRGSKI